MVTNTIDRNRYISKLMTNYGKTIVAICDNTPSFPFLFFPLISNWSLSANDDTCFVFFREKRKKEREREKRKELILKKGWKVISRWEITRSRFYIWISFKKSSTLLRRGSAARSSKTKGIIFIVSSSFVFLFFFSWGDESGAEWSYLK